MNETLTDRPKTNLWKIGFFVLFFLWLSSVLLGLTYFFKTNKPEKTVISPSEKTPIPSPSLVPTIISPTPMIDKNVVLPVVVYEPSGLFSPSDKEELNNKVIKPFFDYNNEKETNFIAMVISKRTAEKYEYSFLAINKNGGYMSSVITKQNEKFDYWVPACMDVCEFSQAYKEKYPEVVKLANPQ